MTADCGTRPLRIIRRLPPPLQVTGIPMPVITGLSPVRKARSMGRHLRHAVTPSREKPEKILAGGFRVC